MRIGVLAHSSITLDSFFVPIIEAWEKDGHSVYSLAGTEGVIVQNDVAPSITRRPTLKNLAAHRQLTEWSEQHKLDVILTNTATASALARFPKLRVPVVYFCHGLHWNTGTTVGDRFWMMIENFLLRNTYAVMSMNSDDCVWFSERFENHRALFLQYGVGVPLREYVPSPLPGGDTLRLLWAGEFSARKRPHLMLEIASILKQRGLNFELQMLGSGSLHEEMVKRASALELDGVVSMPGHQPIQDYMRNSHLFVHTSLWEGLPRVMLEARAMRRQSIAFDVKGSRDIPDLIRVSDSDTHEFANAIMKQSSQVLGKQYSLPPVPAEMDSAKVAESISDFLESLPALADTRSQK